MSVTVSILCLAYNHGKYIRQSLESMVNQKTDFDFEILIHDDASTDDTADIIREFQEKYPEIVKPVFQTENQYSKGIQVQNVYNIPRVKGKYVAYCEGDDYWTDDHKLQKQVDYMEAHPNCTLCIHRAYRINTKGKVVGTFPSTKYTGTVSCEDVIVNGGGFCATCSIMAPAKLMKNRPEYFNILCIDYVIQVYLASCGETYCFDDIMSAYRTGVDGSWSSRMKKDNEKHIRHIERVEKMKRAFDQHTEYKYHDAVEKSLFNSQYSLCYQTGKYKQLLEEPFKSSEIARQQPFLKKVKIFLGAYFPFVLRLLNK